MQLTATSRYGKIALIASGAATDQSMAWRSLWARIKAHGYSSLEPDEKAWVCVRALIDSTSNGGIISYFYNAGADHYYECLHALAELGADRIAAHLQRVGDLFGPRVPTDQDVRNLMMRTWPELDQARDDLLEQIDCDMYVAFPGLERILTRYLVFSGVIDDPD